MPDEFPLMWDSFPLPGVIPPQVEIEFAKAKRMKRWGFYQSLRRDSPWYKGVIRWILARDPICRCCEERPSIDGHHTEYNYDRPFAEQAHELGGVCRVCHPEKIHPRPDTPEAERLRYDLRLAILCVQEEYEANPGVIPAYRTKTAAQIQAIMQQHGIAVTRPIADLPGVSSQMEENNYPMTTVAKAGTRQRAERGQFKKACKKGAAEVSGLMSSIGRTVLSREGDELVAALCSDILGGTVTSHQVRDFRFRCRLVDGADTKGFPIDRMIEAYWKYEGKDADFQKLIAPRILDETGYNWEREQPVRPASAPVPEAPVVPVAKVTKLQPPALAGGDAAFEAMLEEQTDTLAMLLLERAKKRITAALNQE